ncbi:hypothetical protein IQ266_09970 [filamentous cyanobacterium LEGE 11480]|uniref:Uncharacterized protein n=1 Tax=Romeriopsis navalis LEGE 11480 TaxID=2777977 RepID=A0A928VLR5_9CYAN|nr:hypothetical protein [Romeriopsis navalis]MBE9030053.1 hypothetical protein [Romeriopsis navalis LEGE 11480]
MDVLVLIIALISCALWIYNYFFHKQVYQEIEYTDQSTDNIDPWRWRKPNEDMGVVIGENLLYEGDQPLTLKDDAEVSTLIPRSRFNLTDPINHFLGFGCLGLTAFGLLSALIQRPEGWTWLAGVCFLGMGIGWLLINTGSQAKRINLYPDRIEVMTKYAFFLYRNHCYRPHAKLQFKGNYQSMMNMESGQGEPDYKLTVIQPLFGFFPAQRQFLIACNQTQGSWIVSGLKHWNQRAVMTESPSNG